MYGAISLTGCNNDRMCTKETAACYCMYLEESDLDVVVRLVTEAKVEVVVLAPRSMIWPEVDDRQMHIQQPWSNGTPENKRGIVVATGSGRKCLLQEAYRSCPVACSDIKCKTKHASRTVLKAGLTEHQQRRRKNLVAQNTNLYEDKNDQTQCSQESTEPPHITHAEAEETKTTTDKNANDLSGLLMQTLFHITSSPNQARKLLFERMHEAAGHIGHTLLLPWQSLPGLEKGNDLTAGARIAAVQCSFKDCGWVHYPCSETRREHNSEHPWDRRLKEHIWECHSDKLLSALERFLPKEKIDHLYWDVYKEALATLERKSFPATGDSIERRAFEMLLSKYNDNHIRALMCFCCGRIVLDTGSVRTQIEYKHGSWLYSLPKRTLEVNFLLLDTRAGIANQERLLRPVGT